MPRKQSRKPLSHLDDRGHARMVDVSPKGETERVAVAEAVVAMAAETRALLIEGRLPKGDALACARIAGIMAAKRTPDLIPLCHPLPLTSVEVDLAPQGGRAIAIRCTARVMARTGVEMEAMVGAAAAALTVYDMVKGVDRSAEIRSVRLLEKRGGKSGHWVRG